MKITLCLLTLNELKGCQNDIPKINRNLFDEIYAIDGGSTDGTTEYLQSQDIMIYKQDKTGLNAACICGVNHCNTDAIIFYHPKGSIDVSETEKFRDYFVDGYELVVASRNIKNGRNEEDGKLVKPRKWFVQVLGLITHIMFNKNGYYIRDVLHGFRGITKEAFKNMGIRSYGMTIDLEMVVQSYNQNMLRTEFPISENDRISGTTHFKAFPTGKKLLKYLFNEIISGRTKNV